MSRHTSSEERLIQGKDIIRLKALGVSMASIARRKGVSFNTAKGWASKAKKVEHQ